MNIPDPAEFRFLVLNKAATWAQGAYGTDLAIAEDGLTLRQSRGYVVDASVTSQQLPGGLDVHDFALADCSLLYILNGAAAAIPLLTYDPHQGRVETIPSSASLFGQPNSLVYTPGTLYVADDRPDQRIVALAQINWQIRWIVGSTHDAAGRSLGLAQPFTPVDLVLGSDGELYALDATNHVILRFNAGGRLTATLGQTALAATTPTRLAVTPLGALLVLDTANKAVLQLDPDSQTTVQLIDFVAVPADLPIGFQPAGLAVDSQGNIFVGEDRPRPIGDEDTRFLRKFDAHGQDLGLVPGYRGVAAHIAVDQEDRVYIFNREEQKIEVLRPEIIYLGPGATPPPAGTYFAPVFDSREPGMQWHRLVLDVTIPDNTQVNLTYLVTDEAQTLSQIQAKANGEWALPLVNAQDALIRGAAGRYLWLKVRLIGNLHVTPQVRSIRAYFPQISYLRYLPAAFQEDAASRDFMARFLALFETLFTGLEGTIDHVARYFDAAVVSGDFLRWLASWLAIAADESWSEPKLRSLVQRAAELYRKRGTRTGLEDMIEIYTGERPFIMEQFQLRCADPDLQPILAQLYGQDPYCFCVLLKPFTVRSEEERQAVRSLVDASKPAHTSAGVITLQPWVFLDMHTYLGINTYLPKPAARLDIDAALARTTFLAGDEEAGQLDRHARLALDTSLT